MRCCTERRITQHAHNRVTKKKEKNENDWVADVGPASVKCLGEVGAPLTGAKRIT